MVETGYFYEALCLEKSAATDQIRHSCQHLLLFEPEL